nr:tRNA and rRNA cytosine-C5-methylase [bacterium]
PNHHFFKVFGKYCKNKLVLTLDDKNVEKYLRGEQLDIELPKGYGVIMIDGLSLGGFKSSDGVLKNLYPKGLRNF